MKPDLTATRQSFRLLNDGARAAQAVDDIVYALRVALESEPACADTWNALGVALYGAGRLFEAENAFSRALAVHPAHAHAAANRTDLLALLATGPAGSLIRPGVRFAAVCCVYDDITWLREVNSGAYSECDAIYFLVNDRPWNGPPRETVETCRVIESLPDPDCKVVLVRGTWATEVEQRNAGLEVLQRAGYHYCLVLDSDEIYDPAELHRMKALAASAPGIECWHVTLVTYWKSSRFRIEPPEPLKPAIFVKVGSARFVRNRDVEAASRALIDKRVGVCHHLSYARSNEELKRKLASFSHAHEVLGDWYENVWLAWDQDNDLRDLHPTHPSCYGRAVAQPLEQLPPSLRPPCPVHPARFAIATIRVNELGLCFQEIAETLLHGLRALGRDVIALEPNRLAPDRCNIVLGSHGLPHVAAVQPPPGSILYNLEQAGSAPMSYLPDVLRPYTVWDYDAANVAFLRAQGVDARLVPVGYVPELTRIQPAPAQDIDVLFYGAINPRRRRLLDALSRRGLHVVDVYACYGRERDALISRSKVVLNAHFYDPGTFEIVRVSYLLSNRVCVVSEEGAGSEPFRDGVALAPYRELPDVCAAMIDDAAARQSVAERGFAIMRSQPEADILARALDA